MKNFDNISRNVTSINNRSESIINSIDDLKRFLMGFMTEQDYDDIYYYLDSMMKSIESIRDDALTIGWMSDDVKTAILGMKDDNN